MLLEVWKENIYGLDEDSLYYYSRHLRLLANEYEETLTEKRLVII